MYVHTVITQTAQPVICDFIFKVVAGGKVKTLASLCNSMTHAAKFGPRPQSPPPLCYSLPSSGAGACSLNMSVCLIIKSQDTTFL